MNGSTTPTASPSREEQAARIDSSCHVLMIPLVFSLVWLLISSLLALITSVKLHSPTVIANCSWLTYGHTRPAANDAFVYGFASQAGLAIALWILCRLGRNSLVGSGAIAVGSLFWNLGVGLGLLGIFTGHTTGFDWLEFPIAGSAVLLASYAVLGVCGLLTFKARRNAELYPSQWYILAALFWFPWLYTTARLLLVLAPVRGVMQLAVNGWFTGGLFNLWLGSIALAVLLYFIPKLSGAALNSRSLALLAFWTLAIFGGWACFYRGLPLPSWILSAGISATVVLLVPMLAAVFNLWFTLGNARDPRAPLLGFFKISLVFFALSVVFNIFAAIIPQLRLTLFGEGVEQLALYGFVGLSLFGAIHYVAPRLTGVDSNCCVGWNCWATIVGIIIYSGAFILGGMRQQHQLVDGSVPFAQVMSGMKMPVRLSTLGLLLILIGNGAILFRVLSMVRAYCRNCCRCCSAAEESAKLKPVGAAR